MSATEVLIFIIVKDSGFVNARCTGEIPKDTVETEGKLVI